MTPTRDTNGHDATATTSDGTSGPAPRDTLSASAAAQEIESMTEPAETWFLTVFARVERGATWWEFEDFYETHLPRLCSTPAYTWARRYYTRPDDAAETYGHFAVYEFVGREHIPAYLGPQGADTPPLVAPELERFARLQGVSDVSVIMFDQVGGRPFAELMDGDAAIDVSWSTEPTRETDDPEVMRFSKFEHPDLGHHPGTDRYMTVAPRGHDPAGEVSFREELFPISKHWSPW